jgi:hypothetical protein
VCADEIDSAVPDAAHLRLGHREVRFRSAVCRPESDAWVLTKV